MDCIQFPTRRWAPAAPRRRHRPSPSRQPSLRLRPAVPLGTTPRFVMQCMIGTRHVGSPQTRHQSSSTAPSHTSTQQLDLALSSAAEELFSPSSSQAGSSVAAVSIASVRAGCAWPLRLHADGSIDTIETMGAHLHDTIQPTSVQGMGAQAASGGTAAPPPPYQPGKKVVSSASSVRQFHSDDS